MPNPILGNKPGATPNSGTGINHDNANVTLPNSGLNDNVPNSGSDILNTSNSGSNILTMPLCSQLILDPDTNEIRSASDNNHPRSREAPVTGTVVAPIREFTLGTILNQQQTLLHNLMFEIKQLKSKTSITENRVETEKIHLGRPESDVHVSDDDDMEEIRRTVSHKSDIHMELDDLLQAEHISSDEDEDLIKQIEHFFEQDEKCSGKVNDRLAKIVNDGICIRINDDKKGDLLTKHYKPENCENLQVPRVNRGIWTSLGRRARNNDLKLQN